MPRPGLTMAGVLAVLFAVLPVILAGAGEQVPPPLTPTVKAVNTDYTLHWAWGGGKGHTPTFTVQWISRYRLMRKYQNSQIWNTACEETPDLFCDLRPQNLLYLGIFTLRVRANVNGNFSDWTETVFAPAENAEVGPPGKVVVNATDGSALEVSITEPQTSNNTSMKEKIDTLFYRYQYWEHNAEPQRSQVRTIDSPHTIVVLEELKSWTWYCISVRSQSLEPNRASNFTNPVCRQTQGGVPWWQIFLYFLGSLLTAFLFVLGVIVGCIRFCRVIKKPRIPHPVFINQYLNVSPELLRSYWQAEEQCDLVTVNLDPALLQVDAASSQNQADLQEHVNSSGRYSRQSSKGSRDSGVYSTRSNSDQDSAPGSGVSSGVSSGAQADPDLDEVRLQDICTASEHIHLIPDEGFGELRV